MHRKQQLQGGFLQLPDRRSVGVHNQRLADPYRTGRNGMVSSFDLNETQAAGDRGMSHSLNVAQVRNVNTVGQTGIEQIRTFSNLDFLVIYSQGDH
jgi:hypothetical protein